MAVPVPMTRKWRRSIILPSPLRQLDGFQAGIMPRGAVEMKYCPYCGATLATGDSSYCIECGRELAFAQPELKGSTPPKKKKKRFNPAPECEDYDGYYDDVLSEDADAHRERVDKRLVKRIVMFTLIVVVVIASCVTALYLL